MCIIELPLSFYMCEALVNLRLEYVMLNDFDACESFYLPHLEVMHLGSIWIPSDVVLEMLISCSPVLQVLSIYNIEVENLRLKVRSQTLRSLSLLRIFILKGEYDDDSFGDDGESGLVIDTPSLEFLQIRDYPLEYFRVASVSSSIKMCIDARFDGKDDFSKTQTLHKFFAGFSEVTDLSISGNTLHGTYAYSKLQQLPEFKNLTRLYAFFHSDFSEMLPVYLSSCPNLKSIDLELHNYPKMEEIASSPVPQCLKTSIENVKIKMTPKAGQERSPKAETDFANYILENATLLKKLTLWLDEEEEESSSVLEQILKFRNCPFVEVKIGRVASKFRLGYIFEAKPFSRFFSSKNSYY